MKRIWIVLALGATVLACRSGSGTGPAASTKPQWSYSGPSGPEHWGELSPDYALARSGRQQSPVDIDTSALRWQEAAPLEASYQDTSLEILNNGHTIEDDYHGGGTLTVDGHTYRLAQFHFHSPSEHKLDGGHAPMELHLVHKDESGKLAVIGVLIQEGQAHPELARLWEHLPRTPGRTEAVEGVLVNATHLLPESLASYRYTGSLTTPPCSEGVAWFVLRQPIQASAQQIAAFRGVISGNNRPTQPLNGRVISACK